MNQNPRGYGANGGDPRRSYKRRQKRNMTPYYIVLAAMVVIIVVIVIIALVSGGDDDKASSSAVQSGLSEAVSAQASDGSKAPASQTGQTVSEAGSSANTSSNISLALGDWRLLMANAQNPIPDDYTPKVRDIDHSYCQEAGYGFDTRAVDKVEQMIADARADGEHLIVLSAYRPLSSQTRLYNNKVNYYKDLGYSQKEAEEEAAKIVARPGTSDHNLGLAVDLSSLETSFEDSSQFRWLSENAAKYGFVLRYPKDKQDITGISYEPWHYRYVGEEHAAKMNELGMCLEEYVDYLLSK